MFKENYYNIHNSLLVGLYVTTKYIKEFILSLNASFKLFRSKALTLVDQSWDHKQLA